MPSHFPRFSSPSGNPEYATHQMPEVSLCGSRPIAAVILAPSAWRLPRQSGRNVHDTGGLCSSHLSELDLYNKQLIYAEVSVMHFILLSYFRIWTQPKIKYNFEIRKCENIVSLD